MVTGSLIISGISSFYGSFFLIFPHYIDRLDNEICRTTIRPFCVLGSRTIFSYFIQLSTTICWKTFHGQFILADQRDLTSIFYKNCLNRSTECSCNSFTVKSTLKIDYILLKKFNTQHPENSSPHDQLGIGKMSVHLRKHKQFLIDLFLIFISLINTSLIQKLINRKLKKI